MNIFEVNSEEPIDWPTKETCQNCGEKPEFLINKDIYVCSGCNEYDTLRDIFERNCEAQRYAYQEQKGVDRFKGY